MMEQLTLADHRAVSAGSGGGQGVEAAAGRAPRDTDPFPRDEIDAAFDEYLGRVKADDLARDEVRISARDRLAPTVRGPALIGHRTPRRPSPIRHS
jgi:hypothetical protein